MELSALQGQLKVAIQKHQITVGKMKSDPQNALLKKQLREIQAEIVNLSEKQKNVVNKLRKELEVKNNQTPKSSKTVSPPVTLSSVTTNTINVIPSNTRFFITTASENNLKQTQSISVNTGIQSHGLSFRVEKPAINVSVVPPVPTAAQKIIRQVVPSIVGNLVSNSASNLKGTVLFPSLVSTSQTSILTSSLTTTISKPTSTNSSSLLVVPSPLSSSRPSAECPVSSSAVSPSTGNATTTSSFILKLGSPIRVPQYPPPNCRTSSLSNACVTSTVNSCGTVVTAVENIKKEKKSNNSVGCNEPFLKASPVKVKTEGNTKMDFMTALGLINRDVMNELQSKRGERKRRTTANPQFSNAALEEKRRNAAALISAAAAAAAANPFSKPSKKTRGRPRLNISPVQSPPPTPPPVFTANTTTAPTRVENGANVFISRNGTNLVITNTTSQCNSLDTLPVGAHHVRVKDEPSTSRCDFNSSVDNNMPLNCSKKTTVTSSSTSRNNPTCKPLSLSSKINHVKNDNHRVYGGEGKALIKPLPKSNLLNGCLKTVLNKNGGILSEVVLCGICHLRLGAGSGDMLACVGCKRPYHTRCAAKVVPQLNDGNTVNQNAHWKCPKCVISISASTISSPLNNSAVALTVPAKKSFSHHQPWKKEPPAVMPSQTERIAKEEEKQRHLKRRRELTAEVSKLKEKQKKTAEEHAANLQRQAELIAMSKQTGEAINKVHETVNMVRSRIS